MAGMNAEQIHEFRLAMLENTLEPYRYMIMVLVVVMILFLITKFPKCKVAETQDHKRPTALETLKYLAKNSRFRKGIIAQFLYVGMQVAVWSFTIRLALEMGILTNAMPQTLWCIALPVSLLGSLSPIF